MKLRPRFAIPLTSLVFSLALTACNSDPSWSVPSANPGASSVHSDPSGATQPVALDSEERAFIGLINDYRAQNGLAALQVSLALTEASKWMSADMAQKNYFSHTDSEGRDPFARIQAFGYTGYVSAGENIAAGNASASDTFNQWKNSPGHNANMLGSSYEVIGVGRAQGAGSSYGWYWTTDFGSKVDSLLQ